MTGRSMSVPPLLDYQGAADYLGTTTRHVRRLVSERRITYTKVGRLVRFREADLATFVRANTIRPRT